MPDSFRSRACLPACAGTTLYPASPASPPPLREAPGPAVAPRGTATLWVLSAGMFMAILDTNIVNVAMPAMRAGLGASLSELAWIVDVYNLSFAGLMLSAGLLADRLGARRVFLGGLALFLLASALCGLAPTVAALVGARALQGAGAALFLPSSLALLRAAYPDAAARARAVGVFGGLVATAAAAGPVLGGIVLAPLGWRGAFLVNLPAGLLALLAGPRVLAALPARPGRGADRAGQLLGMAALGAASFALIEGPARGWLSPAVGLAALAALVSALAFVQVERRGAAPMIPARLFADPALGGANWVGFVIGAAYFGCLFLLSLYLQQGLCMTPLHTGLSLLPLALCLTAGNVIAGRLLPRLGARRQIAAGLALAALGYLLCALATLHGGLAALLAAMLPLAAGTALAIAPMTATVLERAPSDLAGTASAVLNATRQVGALAGTAGAAAILAIAIGAGGDAGAAMRLGACAAALLSVAGIAGALRIGARPH